MNFVYKLVFFTFLLNVSAGLLAGVTGWDLQFQYKDVDTLNGDSAQLKEDPIGDSDNPGTNDDSWLDSFFGIEIFGWYTKISNFINQYLYGLIGILLNILPFDKNSEEVIAQFLTAAVTLLYGWGIMYYITGKKVNE